MFKPGHFSGLGCGLTGSSVSGSHKAVVRVSIRAGVLCEGLAGAGSTSESTVWLSAGISGFEFLGSEKGRLARPPSPQTRMYLPPGEDHTGYSITLPDCLTSKRMDHWAWAPKPNCCPSTQLPGLTLVDGGGEARCGVGFELNDF